MCDSPHICYACQLTTKLSEELNVKVLWQLMHNIVVPCGHIKMDTVDQWQNLTYHVLTSLELLHTNYIKNRS